MGFPFEPATWDGVSGAIFMGFGGAMPGVFSLIAIVLCLVVLALGQKAEAINYKEFK